MKKTFKIISYLLLAGFFSVALTGCGKKTAVDPNANKVVVWSFESEDVWKSIAKNYATTNKGYTLVYQKQTLDANYENRVLNSILSGNGPDVWAMPNDWVYRHKDELASMPTELTKTYKVKDKFVQSMQESVIFDNKLYALSPSAEPLTLYYNDKLLSSRREELVTGVKDQVQVKKINDLFNTIPKTWSSFTDLTKLITKKDSSGNITLSGVAMGTSKITNSQDILYLLMLQNETEIVSKDLKISSFNLPKTTGTNELDYPGKRAIEFYTSFSDPTSPNYSWNDNAGSDIEAFVNGKTAFILGYSSLQQTFLEKYPDFRFKRAFIPQLTAENDKIVDYASFNAFGVNKLSKNVLPAWKAVTSIADNGGDYTSATRTYSSVKAANATASFQERDGNNPDKTALLTAHSLVKGRYPDEFDSIIRFAINSVNNKSQSSQTAVDWAASKTTELLRKEGW